ncbi:hypothetical protein ACFL6C_10350 [Myxococcota bacterium]
MSALLGDNATCLTQAAEALDAFRIPEAIEHLDCAFEQGPYDHARHVHLYEQWGIANAYLEKNEEALKAFDKLLALDAGYALSYTLSPKATFLFEQARERAKTQPRPWIHLSWPRGLHVADRVPIDIEVVSDRKSFLKTATLYSRRKSDTEHATHDLVLPLPGEYVRVHLPPLVPESGQPEVLEIHLVAFDERGNEVLVVGDPERPREIPLAFEQPTPWYGKWWVWAIAGAVATGVGVGVGFATQDPPRRVPGSFGVDFD